MNLGIDAISPVSRRPTDTLGKAQRNIAHQHTRRPRRTFRVLPGPPDFSRRRLALKYPARPRHISPGREQQNPGQLYWLAPPRRYVCDIYQNNAVFSERLFYPWRCESSHRRAEVIRQVCPQSAASPPYCLTYRSSFPRASWQTRSRNCSPKEKCYSRLATSPMVAIGLNRACSRSASLRLKVTSGGAIDRTALPAPLWHALIRALAGSRNTGQLQFFPLLWNLRRPNNAPARTVPSHGRRYLIVPGCCCIV
jgi:hypothetical protein